MINIFMFINSFTSSYKLGNVWALASEIYLGMKPKSSGNLINLLEKKEEVD